MVMTEAMACRTPVITRPNGSVPEVVDDGKTGFIAGSVEEVAAAIDRLDALEPRTLPASSTAAATQRFQDSRSPAAPPLHHCAVAAASTNCGRVRAVSRLSATRHRLGSTRKGLGPSTRRDAGRVHPEPRRHHVENHPRAHAGRHADAERAWHRPADPLAPVEGAPLGLTTRWLREQSDARAWSRRRPVPSSAAGWWRSMDRLAGSEPKLC